MLERAPFIHTFLSLAADFNSRSGGGGPSSLGLPAVYVTACHYVKLLRLVKEMLPLRRAKLHADLCKYREGVSKMNNMAVRLRRLQEEVAAMQPRLVERQAEAARIMSLLQQEKMDAEATLQAILPEEQQADSAAARKAELVKECEDELNEVMPPLKKALKGLLAIEKTSIAELKVTSDTRAWAQGYSLTPTLTHCTL